MRGNFNNAGTPAACSAIEVLLASYAARELDNAEQFLVDDHLATCQPCQAELAREIYLRQSLETLPLEICPDRVTQNLLLEIAHSEETQKQTISSNPLSRQWTSYLGWSAAAAAAVLLVVSPLKSNQESSTLASADQVTVTEEFSPQEIAAARNDLKRGLLLTAAIINRTERSTVKEVFGQALPKSITRTLKTIMTTPEGEQG